MSGARKEGATSSSFRGFASVLILAGVLIAASITSSDAARSDSFKRSGFIGSQIAVMQQVTVPARVARVEVVPGTNGEEAWAVGRSHANLGSWASSSFGGQVVFLRYRKGSQWELTGPPLDQNGRAINPELYEISIAPGGEGWAVGAGGVMLRKAPGASTWVKVNVPAAGEGTAEAIQFTSVSMTDDQSGFATGTIQGSGPDAGTAILRYRDGTWSRDELGTDIISDGRPSLASVSAVSRDEAWAVTGLSSSSLRIYHRTSSGWAKVNPDRDPQYPTFGGPHPARTKNGGINDSAYGGVVKADSSGAWIGGSITPRDALRPGGESSSGESKRPFVLRIQGGQGTSYCPDIYGVKKVNEDFDPTAICDHAFPFSISEIADIEIVGGQVFAAGIGLFRFSDGGWSREPDSNGYIVSLGFSSPTEGWAATGGASIGLGSAISSSENTIGHWTNQPSRSRVARWPQPNSRPLQSVAVNSNGIALSVGDDGAVMGYLPDVGWDVINSPSLASLHAVAWSSPTTAWIVGAGGTILHFANGRISEVPESAAVTKASLFGIAFVSPTEGYAVGTRGTILRFDGTRWSLDPGSSRATDQNLYGISANRGVVAAAGSNGTVLERGGGRWSASGSAASASIRADGRRSNLNAISVLNDGTVLAGGNKSTLLVKNPSGGFQRFGEPIEGNVLAVGGWRDSSGLRIFASVDPDVGSTAAKFSGDRIVATRSVLMHYNGRLWRDLSLNRHRRIYANETDSPAYVDPILALWVEGPTNGWAAGGIPAIASDPDHLPRTDATSSIYRFDINREPAPPFEKANVSVPKKGHNFAFFAETWCTKGPCGMTMGTGTHADMVALKIREEIGHVDSLPGGIPFTMFGGNGRVVGLPEELSELSGFLQKFPTPVFGAIGNHDLFGGIGGTSAGQTVGGVGSTPGLNFFAPDTALVEVGTHDYWKQAFSSAPAPWGQGARPGFIDPVDQSDIPTLIPPTPGLAQTHYAFDYVSGGRPRYRVVVVDSSARSYGKASDQNPVNEDQRSWLPAVLGHASLQDIPTMVVMNQPTLIPDRTTQFNWKADQDHFMSQVAANRVSAVLTGGARWNVRSNYGTDQANVPGYLMGTGGAPLGYDPPTIASQAPSLLPSDGYYNAWYLINIDPTAPAVLGERLPGQAAVSVTPFPILDFIAIRSIDGTSAPAGNMLRFTALAKSLTGGLADGNQSKATYIPVGDGSLMDCPDGGQGYGACAARDQIDFPYRFYSENPSVADFVVPAVGGKTPLRDANNKVVRDPTGKYGLLCTFNIGSAYINIESGLNRARKKITVGGGFGPCVDAPVLGPNAPNPFAPPVEPVALTEPLPNYFRPPMLPPLDVVAVVLPPAPGPIIAPAPPASAASSRKEKREAELEQQGQDGESNAEARRLIHSKRNAFDDALGYGVLASAILFGLLGAIAAGSVVNRRNRPAFVRIDFE